LTINTHKDLDVWKTAMAAAMDILELTRALPPEERYSLSDQVRRSSRSVAANISEAWMKRQYKGAFLLKLNDAVSEAAETQTWLEIMQRCGYAPAEALTSLDAAYDRIIGQLITMSRQADKWVRPS
jgi:four helix bundle protein